LVLAGLAGCASRLPAVHPTASSRESIEYLIPRTVADRSGWAADIAAALAYQRLEPSRGNVCSVVAVIEQESGFQVNPVIPGLAAMALREIDRRVAEAGIPQVLLNSALRVRSSNGQSYRERIDAARTEKDLSDIFEDFIDGVPLGKTLFADRDPVKTRGPMQVNVAFVEHYAAGRSYPYPIKSTLADEAFTRRGSVYFGVAHLLDYSAPYGERRILRFADYNAGQYASRNAAFQQALSGVASVALVADGLLLPVDAADSDSPGRTEIAARAIARRLDLTDTDIHRALLLGRSREFENTSLYTQVFSLADRSRNGPQPRALIPLIKLHSPKITRPLTTAWYAERVNRRFNRCIDR
jgi:glycosyltransferase involved in cell wall biosynthesis